MASRMRRFSADVGDLAAAPVDDHAAVVGRVVGRGLGGDQLHQSCDGHGHGSAVAQQPERGVAGRAVEVDVAGLVVVEERDHARLAVLHAGDVRDRPGPQELLDAIGHGPVGVAADPRPVGARAGDGVSRGGRSCRPWRQLKRCGRMASRGSCRRGAAAGGGGSRTAVGHGVAPAGATGSDAARLESDRRASTRSLALGSGVKPVVVAGHICLDLIPALGAAPTWNPAG